MPLRLVDLSRLAWGASLSSSGFQILGDMMGLPEVLLVAVHDVF